MILICVLVEILTFMVDRDKLKKEIDEENPESIAYGCVLAAAALFYIVFSFYLLFTPYFVIGIIVLTLTFTSTKMNKVIEGWKYINSTICLAMFGLLLLQINNLL